ncbi:hypothetical protein LUZ60_014122 [Juncus effusus]|nr:hypothetical protein LUZ60_014122 [Juncus effusus]
MSSQRSNCVDSWLEIISEEGDQNPKNHQVNVVYCRRRPQERTRTELERTTVTSSSRDAGISFRPFKRTSWTHSLSIRGRESIIVEAGEQYQPKPKPKEASKKPPKPILNKKGKGSAVPLDLTKEKEYFEQLDATELLEESPSPKKNTWTAGAKQEIYMPELLPDLKSILARWKLYKSPLFKITKTPSDSLSRTERALISSFDELGLEERSGGLGGKMGECHVAQREPSIGDDEVLSAFMQLLMACNQTVPVSLNEILSTYCEPSSIRKLGEGTYGEAFRVGPTVFKIVPIDGNTLVNGEIQKKSEEVLEEVLLSLTLNNLRGEGNNSCTGFIESKDFKVCKGAYDVALIKAWENWDTENGSENDHPNEFKDDQCYIIFVLADGGKDLESFVLFDYNEARSLLLQVTASLAVAETACEFEHRDLHWGNILLSRDERENMSFILEGERMEALTFGLTISIIDFTLSRINTGNAILFLDLSADPALFEGPKRDIQSETYRKMKKVTEDCWDGSFPKTNVLWLVYLVDILLLNKSFKRTKADERELRSFKKRLNSYECAKDCLSDPLFNDLFIIL